LATQLQQHLVPLALDVLRLCAWLVLLLFIFVPVERLCAHHPQKVFRKAFGTDVVYFFLSGLLPKLLFILPLTLVAAGFHLLVPSHFYASVGELPLWVRLAAAIVVGEVGTYWAHRWSHDVPLLWRFHSIHHSAEEIDWLVNSRGHPFDLAFTRLCGLAPMYALGLAQPTGNGLDLVPVLVILIGTVWGFFIHANVGWRFGWLESLVSTPAFHHWHHANDSPDLTYQNFAPMLPWVDRCFGTFYLPSQAWPMKYGTDASVAPTLAGQLLRPLKLWASSPAVAVEPGPRPT
jgi:sterol desaturase/sphingolipid hydroxylase (fatty acid hydroxylase superfamily)